MEQLDQAATEKVLRAMSVAGVDLDQLASEIKLTKTILLRRMSEGRWKLIELGLIAQAVGCRTSDLVPDPICDDGAAA
ncbi:hypothetical protein [Nocardia sp. NPDC057440]|uniref:hypothetical protein n=1 Tax=Nocardia sp. NPDC057440 TaxID=3346134 RepID=UPI00366DFF30